MSVVISVNADFRMRIKCLNGGNCISKGLEQEVLDSLKSGDMVVSMNEKTITSLDNLSEPLYSFELDVSDFAEYEYFSQNGDF
ncbi:MAG: hypothetical protein QM504_06590 [Pseudomonadota bacterium]